MAEVVRESFVFLSSWLESIDEVLKKEDADKFIASLVRFGIYNTKPEVKAEKGLMLQCCKHLIKQAEKHERRVEAGRIGGQNSRGGGAPYGNQNAKNKHRNNKQTTSKQQANVNVNDNENVNDNVNDNDNYNLSLSFDTQEKEKERNIKKDEAYYQRKAEEYNAQVNEELRRKYGG